MRLYLKMDSTISKIHQTLDSTLKYLTPLLPIANCHMVEFLTHNHWETLLPKTLKDSLKCTDLNDALENFWKSAKDAQNLSGATELDKWIKNAQTHYLKANNDYCLTKEQLQDRIKSWGGEIKPDIEVKEFMSSKKSYEVQTMCGLVASLYSASDSTCCVEVGGGRGPLLAALSLAHGVPSLTLDCDARAVGAAQRRSRAMKKQWHAIARRVSSDGSESAATAAGATRGGGGQGLQQCATAGAGSEGGVATAGVGVGATVGREGGVAKATAGSEGSGELHRCARAFVTSRTDLAAIARELFPQQEDVRLLLTGLHTCGNLGPDSLRMFAANPWARALLTVPCCYHLLAERGHAARDAFRRDHAGGEPQGETGFPMSHYLQGVSLGRNARMLAAQSLQRAAARGRPPARSLLHRAALQVVIKERLPDAVLAEGRLKRASKCDNFKQYLRMADSILKLNLVDTLPDTYFTELNESMDDHWKKLVVFYLIRLCLAQVIESIMLLDRLLYLMEHGFENVCLVQLFDPVLSPRCHGIVAVREHTT